MQYRIKMLATALAMCLVSTHVWAADGIDVVAEMDREVLNLKHKIERLEKSREMEKTPEAESGRWLEHTELSGLVEVEASYLDGPNGSASDLVVSTVELGLDNQVNPWVNAHTLILFEEDETDPPEFDEAIITLANPEESPFSLAAGRQYVPFGHYDSAEVSDPLTLEIGETRETAVQLGYTANGFQALAYAFNGDTRDGGDDHIDSYGLALDYSREAQGTGPGFDAGLSWINNLADSGTLQGAVTNPNNLVDTVAGWSAYATLHWDAFILMGEYLTAADHFNAADLAFNGAGARPSAWNLELDYAFGLAGQGAEAAVSWQGTDEAQALDLPETRWLAALSVGFYDHTSLALEYAHEEDYGVSDGGSGDNADTVTLQLAVAF